MAIKTITGTKPKASYNSQIPARQTQVLGRFCKPANLNALESYEYCTHTPSFTNKK